MKLNVPQILMIRTLAWVARRNGDNFGNGAKVADVVRTREDADLDAFEELVEMGLIHTGLGAYAKLDDRGLTIVANAVNKQVPEAIAAMLTTGMITMMCTGTIVGSFKPSKSIAYLQSLGFVEDEGTDCGDDMLQYNMTDDGIEFACALIEVQGEIAAK